MRNRIFGVSAALALLALFNTPTTASGDWLFTPYIGAGASLGQSQVGGGVSSTLLVNGLPATQADIDNITAAFAAAGQAAPDLSSTGILVQAESKKSWAFRAFGGVSANLLIFKLDLTAMYNFTTKSYGGSVGFRVQL